MDIISAYQQVGTYRGAAVMCGTTHKTVKRIIERRRRAARRQTVRSAVTIMTWSLSWSRTGCCDEGADLGEAAAARGEGRGVCGVGAESPAAGRRGEEDVARDHHRGRRPAVWTPGEVLAIDWGSAGPLHVFCAVLAWSRFRFVRFAGNERSETTLAMLAECFEELGGVPKVVLADRMGCLKGGVVANKVVPAPDYVRFATHYSFRPDWCEAADPESKGIVENLVGYAKRDLIVPQAPFTDMTAANIAASQWCAEVNGVAHSEICSVPAERLEAERDLLTALPSLRPAIGKAAVTRKVDRLSCIRFGSARYSVPTRLIGQHVAVTESGGRLLVADAATGEVVASHIPAAPGEARVLDEHYGGPRPAPRRAVRPKTAAEKAFIALGPAAGAFLTGSAASGNTKLAADLDELAALRAAHGDQALTAALERAVAFRRWRAADVRSILAAGAGIPQPSPAGGALIIELPKVPVRPLSACKIEGAS